MSTAASVTMAADSTQGELQDEKKKKKHKSHKKYKKKRRDSSSDTSVDSDLDLDKEMHPISHYVKDREVLVQQLFKSITATKLRAMLPEVLKPFSIEELRSFCLEQLEVMSRKRILRILQGEDPENISSSSTEDESEEEKEKSEDKKKEISPPAAEAGTSASVSEAEAEGTLESAAASGGEEEGEGMEGEVEEEVEEVEEVEEPTEDEEVEEDSNGAEEVEKEEVGVEEVEGTEEETEEEVIEEIEVEEEVTEGETGEEVEYEEVEIEVEEEEGENESNKGKEGRGLQSDIRKVELKDEGLKIQKLQTKRSTEGNVLQIHADQGEFDELVGEATSGGNTKKPKLGKAVTVLQVASSGVETTQPGPSAADVQKRRVKLKRDALLPQTKESSPKPSQSSSQPKRIVKATKRKSTEQDPLSHLEASTSEGASGPRTDAPREIVLSKNQMEILELEMRARAIKAMLKMHST